MNWVDYIRVFAQSTVHIYLLECFPVWDNLKFVFTRTPKENRICLCEQNPKAVPEQLAVDSVPDPRRHTPQIVEKKAKKAHAARPINVAKKSIPVVPLTPIATNRSGQKTARSDDSGGTNK